jgi:amino acid transporter
MGQAGYVLMCGITLVTAVNTFNSGFITASRFVYATAREGSLPRAFARLNDNAVPWLPVVLIGGVALVASLLVAVTDGWKVLVATGAALEAGIYAVAAFCVLRLRRRQPDSERPFRMPAATTLGWIGVAVFGFLALAASVSVDNKTNAVPLAIIVLVAAAAAGYVLVGLPRVRAAEEARRAAQGTRRRRPGPSVASQEAAPTAAKETP